jgi:hypothetical protein
MEISFDDRWKKKKLNVRTLFNLRHIYSRYSQGLLEHIVIL